MTPPARTAPTGSPDGPSGPGRAQSGRDGSSAVPSSCWRRRRGVWALTNGEDDDVDVTTDSVEVSIADATTTDDTVAEVTSPDFTIPDLTLPPPPGGP